MTISEKHNKDKRRQQTGESDREEAIWEPRGLSDRTWDAGDGSEDIVAALRGFFLTHTLDPLTGEVHTVH